MTLTTSAFDLPDRLAGKRDARLIGADDAHFAAIADSLEEQIGELTERLAAERLRPGGQGQEAMDRDIEIHRLSARLRVLRRFTLDLCLGRIVPEGGDEPVYIGRLSLSDRSGKRLLIDWRAPAAEPFFAATHANPMGLASRRRYRWTGGRVSDYWDEVFTEDGLAGNAALDDQSAFIASLGSSRSTRMRDVLSTIQSDQDAIIRAGSSGALVVDGGPGTGKTVVALHRAAYLLYADPRISRGDDGVLFVGPSDGYLAYVGDVLPSLGEESVQISTLRGLVPEGPTASVEADPRVAALKASRELLSAMDAAVRFYEIPPSTGMTVETLWAELRLTAADWAEAFDAAEPGTPHNQAREQVREALLDLLIDRLDGEEVPPHVARKALVQNEELNRAFSRAWPLLDPVGVVSDLWSVPAYLRACAPGIDDDDIATLQRADPRAWTVSDLPYLDAARQRIGDPEAPALARRRAALLAAQQEQMASVVEDLIAADDSEMLVMSMLRRDDAKNSLIDESDLPSVPSDALAGPFAHVVVDEAQELTDAEWDMLLRRCPSRSFTIVGDRAQARHGFTETWQDRLHRAGLKEVDVVSLTINYRTPSEVMAEAEPVIRAAVPDANVPTSIRSNGVPVVHGSVSDLEDVLDTWLAQHALGEGVAAVIGVDPEAGGRPEPSPRVRSLTPELSKGLEFDLVVVVEPDRFGSGVEGAVDRYVAMTRATEQLVVLSSE
ncbi:RNA polymerase recycling motor ATPase HelR [Leifsonia sp. SIMBA_070]|uniref:RNA polymerase recycling motor ATPase HelR n=1 Tax=Leifsonia sp. SIMBA_070 TaxID=3085810 RepID=UPI003978B514